MTEPEHLPPSTDKHKTDRVEHAHIQITEPEPTQDDSDKDLSNMTNFKSMTGEESDIMEHAKNFGVHVKKAGPHSGHCWYCFDCKCMTTDHIGGHEVPHQTNHKSFDSNKAIKSHLERIHDVHWSSGYFLEEDGC